MKVFVTMERDGKSRWAVTFAGPKGGGALPMSRTLATALKALSKVLLREFPEPKPKSDLLIPPIGIDTDPESPFDFPPPTSEHNP